MLVLLCHVSNLIMNEKQELGMSWHKNKLCSTKWHLFCLFCHPKLLSNYYRHTKLNYFTRLYKIDSAFESKYIQWIACVCSTSLNDFPANSQHQIVRNIQMNEHNKHNSRQFRDETFFELISVFISFVYFIYFIDLNQTWWNVSDHFFRCFLGNFDLKDDWANR